MTIKRNYIILDGYAVNGNNAFGKGECCLFYKKDGQWLTKANGRVWKSFASHLRNGNFYHLVGFTMWDIVFALFERNVDCQTVCFELLEEAVYTAIDELTEIKSVGDIIEYITENLI